MKIGIVGLGLIGGSMAKSIKARTSHTVYGIDLDQETMTLAWRVSSSFISVRLSGVRIMEAPT